MKQKALVGSCAEGRRSVMVFWGCCKGTHSSAYVRILQGLVDR